MKYVGEPRWRYLLVPLALFSILPGAAISLLSLGTVRGLHAAIDFFDWATYG